jgi:hypothetical protein
LDFFNFNFEILKRGEWIGCEYKILADFIA